MPELYDVYCEEKLILFLKQGDRLVFNYLYKNYAPALYAVISKIIADEHIAQDVLQDTFTKIWRKIELYNPDKGRIFTWMINIARNAAKDVIRTKSEQLKQKSQSADVMHYMAERSPARMDAFDMKNLVLDLCPKYQVVIRMFYYQAYSIAEISVFLSVPEGTVKTRLRTALQLLRDKFYYTNVMGLENITLS